MLLESLRAASPGSPWTSRGQRDGVRLETRDVPGSAFEEVRATVWSPAQPGPLCEAVWGKDTRVLEAGFKKRQLLKETPTERWTYEQVATPVVSDRDYTIHLRREDAADGGCRITFDTQNEVGPPPQPGFVRIPLIRGTWEVRPSPGRGTEIVYIVYSEPGGAIPAFLARGPSRDRAVEWLKVILSRASRAPAPPPRATAGPE